MVKFEIDLYIGYNTGVCTICTIELVDEGIFPLEDIVYHYMKKHKKDHLNMVFYTIKEIKNHPDYT